MLRVLLQNAAASNVMRWSRVLCLWCWWHEKWLILSMLDFNSLKWLLVVGLSKVWIFVTLNWEWFFIFIFDISDASFFFTRHCLEIASWTANISWPSIDTFTSSCYSSTITSYRALSIVAPLAPVLAFSSCSIAHIQINRGTLASDFALAAIYTLSGPGSLSLSACN